MSVFADFVDFVDTEDDDDFGFLPGLVSPWTSAASAKTVRVAPSVPLGPVTRLPPRPPGTKTVMEISSKISDIVQGTPQIAGSKIHLICHATQWPRIIQRAATVAKKNGRILRVIIADTELPWTGRGSIPLTLEILRYGR